MDEARRQDTSITVGKIPSSICYLHGILSLTYFPLELSLLTTGCFAFTHSVWKLLLVSAAVGVRYCCSEEGLIGGGLLGKEDSSVSRELLPWFRVKLSGT